ERPGVVQGFRRLQPVQAQEGFLGDLGGVLGVVQLACQVALQGSAVGCDQVGKKLDFLVCRQGDRSALVTPVEGARGRRGCQNSTRLRIVPSMLASFSRATSEYSASTSMTT